MNLQNLRWPVVVATMAATVAALFGFGFVVKSQTVEEPLKKVYASSPAVVSYTIDNQGDHYVITTRLKDVPDLAQTYVKLNSETAKVMKGTAYEIQIEDRRTDELEQAYRRSNLYVQEALATGQFATMADRVEYEAAKAGVTARFDVDQKRVYVQLRSKDGAYLYSVTNRLHPQQPATLGSGGGTGQ